MTYQDGRMPCAPQRDSQRPSRDLELHPGINFSKLEVGGDIGGLGVRGRVRCRRADRPALDRASVHRVDGRWRRTRRACSSSGINATPLLIAPGPAKRGARRSRAASSCLSAEVPARYVRQDDGPHVGAPAFHRGGLWCRARSVAGRVELQVCFALTERHAGTVGRHRRSRSVVRGGWSQLRRPTKPRTPSPVIGRRRHRRWRPRRERPHACCRPTRR